MTTLSLSVTSMLTTAYAHLALAAIYAPEGERPMAPGPDREPLLRRLMADACATICACHLPMVVSTNLDDFDPATDSNIIIDIDADGLASDPSAVRRALEQAVVLTAIGSVSEPLALMRDRALERLAATVSARASVGAAIKPAWV